MKLVKSAAIVCSLIAAIAATDTLSAHSHSMETTASGDSNDETDRLTRAIERNPKDAEAYVARGNIRRERGAYSSAIADYDQAIKLDPKNAKAYSARGVAHAQWGDYEKAIADFGETIKLDPKQKSAYNNRGFAYAYSGDYEKAIADFGETIKLEPSDGGAYNNRGNAYKDLGDLKNAESDAIKACELGVCNLARAMGLNKNVHSHH
ncbi:MAG: tetratricopeptide repeat protein [Helicobacteraceae bacterium]|jgi:Flp pilus assembly protein TadD|nr:tetratricopeptide repeat protein [Helicobacteraceae bacterium]